MVIIVVGKLLKNNFIKKNFNGFTLAVDTMGGDFGPNITVPATIQAMSSNKEMNVFLVGDMRKISLELKNVDFSIKNRIKIIPTKLVVQDEANLFKSIRYSHGSSMRVALELVKFGKAQACISAGNTSVLMALSKILIKTIKKINRPALMAMMPNKKNKKTLVLDLGANINCNSSVLIQFAIMGSAVSKKIFNIKNPKISLLNIGQEINKGLDNIKQAAKFLKNHPNVNYIGYLEAHDVLSGNTDVLVCDGFVGNIMIKTMEGVVKTFFSILNIFETKKNEKWWKKIIIYLDKKKLSKYFYYLNPDQYNGACLLGLKKIVIKSHGSANQKAFFIAIKKAEQTIICDIPNLISKSMSTILPEW